MSGPIDTTAREGDTVHLNCRSNLTTTVKWILGHPASHSVRPIFVATSDMKGTIHPDFMEDFRALEIEMDFRILSSKMLICQKQESTLASMTRGLDLTLDDPVMVDGVQQVL